MSKWDNTQRLYSVLALKDKIKFSKRDLTDTEAQIFLAHYEKQGYTCQIYRADAFGEGMYA